MGWRISRPLRETTRYPPATPFMQNGTSRSATQTMPRVAAKPSHLILRSRRGQQTIRTRRRVHRHRRQRARDCCCAQGATRTTLLSRTQTFRQYVPLIDSPPLRTWGGPRLSGARWPNYQAPGTRALRWTVRYPLNHIQRRKGWAGRQAVGPWGGCCTACTALLHLRRCCPLKPPGLPLCFSSLSRLNACRRLRRACIVT